MGKTIMGLVCLAALVACVRVNSNMLDSRTVVISGRGTAFDNAGGVQRAVLQKAAQEAQAAGFAYFRILSSQDETRQGVVVVPGQTYTNGVATANCIGAFCSGNYSSSSYTTPSSAFGVVKPGVDIYVRFYREGEIDPGTPGVWNVASVLAVSAQGAVAASTIPVSPSASAVPSVGSAPAASPSGVRNEDLIP